jgi:hypothetical protein
MQAASDVPQLNSCRDISSRWSHDVRILTPHTTTKASIVTDASSKALSMEANLINATLRFLPRYNVK